MTDTTASTEDVPRLTLDDVKHKAETVKDVAITEANELVRVVVAQDVTRFVIAAAVVMGLAVSIAYAAGSRRCRPGA